MSRLAWGVALVVLLWTGLLLHLYTDHFSKRPDCGRYDADVTLLSMCSKANNCSFTYGDLRDLHRRSMECTVAP